MTKSLRRILIISDSDSNYSSIEFHQIKWLLESYDVDVLSPGINKLFLNHVNYITYSEGSFFERNSRKLLLLLRRYEQYTFNKTIKKAIKTLVENHYDIIITHHIRLLPFAFEISRTAKIILHAHEYYMQYNSDQVIWKLLIKDYWDWLASEYINRCDSIITVNESIKRFYAESFGGDVHYLHNLVSYEEIDSSEVRPDRIKIIHHGLASKSRKIELMLELADYLDERFTLSLILVNYSFVGKLYIRKLKMKAKKNPKIEFLKPVSFNKIIEFGNQFDIGLFFMPPSNINEEYSLGHKFFQYIQSRLALAISPLPEMKRLVEQYGLGIISPNFNPKSLANEINKLSPDDIKHFKNNSNKVAKDFDVENNRIKFHQIIMDVLAK